MIWQWTPYIIPMLFTSALSAALSAYLLRYRHRQIRERAGAAMLLAGAVWTLGYAFELASAGLQAKVFWAKAQYLGILVIPTAWLIYALEYANRGRWLTRRKLTFLSIVPLVFLGLVFTNEAHGLMWRRAALSTYGSTTMLVQDMSVGFYAFLMHTTLLIATGLTLLVRMFVRWRSLYRRQIWVLAAACSMPVLASLIEALGIKLLPQELDLEPFMFALVGLLVAWGLFRVRLGDIVPMANEFVIKGMSDAVMVLDAQDRVLEMNPACQALIGSAAGEAIGQPIVQLWPTWPEDTDHGHRVAQRREIVIEHGGQRHNYDVRVSPIVGRRETALGHVVVLRNISERKRMEAELRTLNEELEARVEARTAALSEANARLAHEIDDRRQAEDELLRRNRELLSLQAATTATSSCLDLLFVLDTVTWEMSDLLRVDRCAVYEWLEDPDELSLLAEYGAVERDDGESAARYGLARYPIKKRVLVERYARQMSIYQPDVDPAELEYMHRTGVKSLLLLPMVFQDHVVGMVEIKQDKGERLFTDEEISLAQLLANQTAVAVENARLYERAQQEIAERMRAEEQIKASLQEKVVLLKEIHHRVKNNLQVISSLLNLQSRSIEDAKTLETLRDSQNRIRSMALIHEKLYRSQDLARIDFAEYVRNLSSFLVRSYRSRSGPVDLKVDSDDVFLSVDSAVPCGLIINELVSNALKHAFIDGSRGEIRIAIRGDTGSAVRLVVSDNGVGFPEDVDFRETESLGLQLVNTLVDQLEGTVDLHRNHGTAFEIAFASA